MTENKRFTYLIFVVVCLAMFVAVFFSINNTSVYADDKYTITWRANGQDIDTTEVAAGETPSYDGSLIVPATVGYHYEITGWTPEIVAASENTTYDAILSELLPNDNTQYKVHVYKQQATGDGYDDEYLNKSGTTDADVTVEDTFEHFTLDTGNINNVLQGKIKADGSLVLVAYYIRDTFNVTWKNWDDSILGEVETYRYGATPQYSGDTPTKPSITGYNFAFAAWTPDITQVTEDATYKATFNEVAIEYVVSFGAAKGCTLTATKNGEPFASGGKVIITDELALSYSVNAGYTENALTILPDEMFDRTGNTLTNIHDNLVITATATANADTAYVVKVYVQNIDDDDYSELETINCTGTTDTKAQYTPQERTGLHYIEHQDEVLEANINGDGSTQLKVYYDRNTYNITWLNWNETPLKENPDELRYEATPSYSGDTPTKNINGYTSTFNGWTPAIVKATQDATYKAIFNDEAIEYTLTLSSSNGTTLQVIKNGTDNMESGDKYTITDYLDIRYSILPGYTEANFVINADEDKYTYDAGFNRITNAYVDIEIVLNATPNPDTPYTVYIYLQNIEDNDYTEMEPIVRNWITDTQADITDEEIEGFHLNASHEGTVLKGNIAGDGTLELYAYFDRNTFTITWLNASAILETDDNVKYGATPTFNSSEPTKEKKGYTYVFIGWEPQVGLVVEDRIYRAQFSETINKYTITYPSAPGFTLLVKNANQESVVSGAEVTIVDELTIMKSLTPGYSYAGELQVNSENDDFEYDASQGTLSSINENVELILSATPNDYTITFNQDNIDPMQTTAQIVTFSTIATLVLPTKSGYDFIGWYYNDEPFTNKDGLMLHEYNNPGDIEVYAHFAESKYIITYDSYFEGETKEVEYNSTYTLKVPTRVGHVFDGWCYVNDQLTDETGASIGVYSYPQNIQIESKWTKITIELDLARVVIENDISKVTKINATVDPVGSSKVTFTSSNEDAFIVDQEGNVTCVGIGRATIRAILDDGKDYAECECISVDKIYTNDECVLYIDINEGLDLSQYAILCAPLDKLKDVVGFVKEQFSITNKHISRTDIGVELDENMTIEEAKLKDGNTLVINLFYSVEKEPNPVVNYKIVNPLVEYGKPCYIEDIRAKAGYKFGKLVAKSENLAPVTVYQDGYYLIMVNSNVVTNVLITEIDNVKTNIENLIFEAKDGWDPTINVAATSIALDAYDKDINIPSERQVIYALYVEFTRGEEMVDCSDKEYTIKMPIPDEFRNQEQIKIRYLENGETKTRSINIKDGYVELALTGSGDFVFISNVLESTVYLYWLIVLLLFLDAFFGMIVIILFVNYQDALQRRRDINGYSTILPIALLCAVVAGELALVIFLGLVFVVELIAIAWLGLKLTNKYFLYTTYNKLSYNPYRENHNIENKNTENNSNNE